MAENNNNNNNNNKDNKDKNNNDNDKNDRKNGNNDQQRNENDKNKGNKNNNNSKNVNIQNNANSGRNGNQYVDKNDVFGGYVDNAIDPSPWMVVANVGYSVVLAALLVAAIAVKKCRRSGESYKKQSSSIAAVNSLSPRRKEKKTGTFWRALMRLDEEEDYDNPTGDESSIRRERFFQRVFYRERAMKNLEARSNAKRKLIPSTPDPSSKSTSSTSLSILRRKMASIKISKKEERNSGDVPLTVSSAVKDTVGGLGESFLPESEGKNASDPWRTPYHPIKVLSGFESNRLFKLAVPLTMYEIVDAFVNVAQLGVISNFFGSDFLVAYSAVQWMFSISMVFAQSMLDAEYTLVAHSVGGGNSYLAGQYIQIVILFQFIYAIPVILLGWYCTEAALLGLGFSNHIAQMGLQYARSVCFSFLVENVHDGYAAILDVIDHEKFKSALGIAECITTLFVITYFVVNYEDVQCSTLGIIETIICTGFFVVCLVWSLQKKWLDPFLNGMVVNSAITNFKVVSKTIRTGATLACGELLQNCEWEFLTFFAAHHGPGEVAAWILLGSIWELIEAATSGLGGALEVRAAFHLGNGDVQQAKESAYSCLFFGIATATLMLVLVLMWGSNLVACFTDDEDLQDMLAGIIPLLAVGNLTMIFGTMAESLLEAQGRFRLVTVLSMISLLVTVPAAALMTYVLDFNLQGLAGALVFGFSTSSTAMAYCLVQSDWEKIAAKIAAQNADSTADSGGILTFKNFIRSSTQAILGQPV